MKVAACSLNIFQLNFSPAQEGVLVNEIMGEDVETHELLNVRWSQTEKLRPLRVQSLHRTDNSKTSSKAKEGLYLVHDMSRVMEVLFVRFFHTWSGFDVHASIRIALMVFIISGQIIRA